MSDRTGGFSPAGASPGAGPQAGGAAREAQAAAAQATETARGVARDARQEAQGIVSDLKQEGAEVLAAAETRGRDFAAEQQQVGAGHAESVARAVHGAAGELEASSPQLAGYVREAATAVDGFAKTLRDSSPQDVMGHVQDLAQRQPVAFFGAAVLAGFALARFAKSASPTGQLAGSAAASGRVGHADDNHAAPRLGGPPSGVGAPGWVPTAAPGQPADAPMTTQPATMAAASLGGAVAHAARTADPAPRQPGRH